MFSTLKIAKSVLNLRNCQISVKPKFTVPPIPSGIPLPETKQAIFLRSYSFFIKPRKPPRFGS